MIHISLTPDIIGHVGDFPVTNTLVTSWIIVLLLCAGSIFVFKKLKKIPNGLQNIAEIIIDSFLSFMETVAGGRKEAERFFPLVATIFIYVLVSNWIGILPGVGSIGFFHEGGHGFGFVPLFRSVYSDLNMTVALALISVIATHFYGIFSIGWKHHLSKFFNFHGPINFFVGILELVGEFARILSFSFRLFGNVFAGEVLLVVMVFLIPYAVPVPFLGLELFVGFIQAVIFAVLTMVSLSLSTKAHAH